MFLGAFLGEQAPSLWFFDTLARAYACSEEWSRDRRDKSPGQRVSIILYKAPTKHTGPYISLFGCFKHHLCGV